MSEPAPDDAITLVMPRNRIEHVFRLRRVEALCFLLDLYAALGEPSLEQIQLELKPADDDPAPPSHQDPSS